MTCATILRRRNMVSSFTGRNGAIMAIRTSKAGRERDCPEGPEAGMINCREGKAAAGSVTHTTTIAGKSRISMNDRQGLGASGRTGNG
jgi:hypothetical protein